MRRSGRGKCVQLGSVCTIKDNGRKGKSRKVRCSVKEYRDLMRSIDSLQGNRPSIIQQEEHEARIIQQEEQEPSVTFPLETSM